jgi:dGTPase
MEEMKAFLFRNVYIGSAAKMEEAKAVGVLRQLYAYFSERPGELPENGNRVEDEIDVRIIDYLAGMTDQFALREYVRLFMPNSWED